VQRVKRKKEYDLKHATQTRNSQANKEAVIDRKNHTERQGMKEEEGSGEERAYAAI
jgi:hypothetical protein